MQQLDDGVYLRLVHRGAGDIAGGEHDAGQALLVTLGARRRTEIAFYGFGEGSAAPLWSVPVLSEELGFERGGFFFGNGAAIRLSTRSNAEPRSVRERDVPFERERPFPVGPLDDFDGHGFLSSSSSAVSATASKRIALPVVKTGTPRRLQNSRSCRGVK